MASEGPGFGKGGAASSTRLLACTGEFVQGEKMLGTGRGAVIYVSWKHFGQNSERLWWRNRFEEGIKVPREPNAQTPGESGALKVR